MPLDVTCSASWDSVAILLAGASIVARAQWTGQAQTVDSYTWGTSVQQKQEHRRPRPAYVSPPPTYVNAPPSPIPQSPDIYVPVASGAYSPQSDHFAPSVAGCYYAPQNGTFIPGQ
ncbi:hypothetical protein WL01_03975 [Burkholderia ubonensis]|nr:hypothetical protein WL01_03975 [Burkholderia ubonensis]KWB38522.1 hypothetical protein WL33_00950 [Burkholderia ubonensis]KWC23349.1 hypothetical protein WL50_01430 [Burkholderia ubonensis]